jgi:hypothetical protein
MKRRDIAERLFNTRYLNEPKHLPGKIILCSMFKSFYIYIQYKYCMWDFIGLSISKIKEYF